MATPAQTLPTDLAAPIRRAAALGWILVLGIVAADLIANDQDAPAADVGAVAAATAAGLMVASLASSGRDAWAWFRRGVFLAVTVMAARAFAAGVILGWGFDAWLSVTLAVTAAAMWLAARRMDDA